MTCVERCILPESGEGCSRANGLLCRFCAICENGRFDYSSESPVNDASRETDSEARWFGVSARTLILVALVLYAAVVLTYRVAFAEDEDSSLSIGQSYSDLVFFLGPPDKTDKTDDGELILHYDEVRVEDGVFVKSGFRIRVDRNYRTYAFERD